jgi:uroporphyrinogen decarboxylase
MAKLRYVFDAIRETKRALAGRLPLIGFAGSPFTLACYMIEGSGSADFATVRRMAYRRPDLLHRLVAINARAVTAYLNEQIRAGADALMLFDTWGGMLTTDAFRSFSLASMRSVLAALAPGADGRPVPTIAFTKGGGQWLDELAAAHRASASTGPAISRPRDGVSAHASRCRQSGSDIAYRSGRRSARSGARRSRLRAGSRLHFQPRAWNRPATPPENVAALVEAVHREPSQPAPALDLRGTLGKMPQTRWPWFFGLLTTAKTLDPKRPVMHMS